MEHLLERKLITLIVRAYNDRTGTDYGICEDTLMFGRGPALSLNGLLSVKIQGNHIRLEYEDGVYFLTEGGVECTEVRGMAGNQ